jgi:hypothetical protein
MSTFQWFALLQCKNECGKGTISLGDDELFHRESAPVTHSILAGLAHLS